MASKGSQNKDVLNVLEMYRELANAQQAVIHALAAALAATEDDDDEDEKEDEEGKES